eukprot:COSAG05_NODE_8575_length_691_cov_1.445946_1_plen_71_part_10
MYPRPITLKERDEETAEAAWTMNQDPQNDVCITPTLVARGPHQAAARSTELVQGKRSLRQGKHAPCKAQEE